MSLADHLEKQCDAKDRIDPSADSNRHVFNRRISQEFAHAIEMSVHLWKKESVDGAASYGGPLGCEDAPSNRHGKKEASSIKQEPQPEDRPPGSFIHGQSNTPGCTARLYRLICSFRFRKSGVDPLNCVRRCSVSTMGSNSNATATFSATSILTGPLSVSGDMISNGASDTHHESASAIGKRTWPGL